MDPRPTSAPADIVTIDPTPDDRLAPLRDQIRATPAGVDLASKRAGALWAVDDDRAWLAEAGYVVESLTVDGVSALLITPPGPTEPGLLVTYHGGGYVLCSAGTHAKRFALMGAAARCRVLVVDYRLAPEHPFPAAFEDGVAAALWAAEREPIVLCGDSAGGGLALSVGVHLKGASDRAPSGIVAISPWTDLTNSAPSLVDRLDRDPFAHFDDLPDCTALYLGAGGDPHDPKASPLFADLAGLAPTLIQVGSEESMFDDGLRFATRAAAAGVAVRFEEWQGLFHTWHAHAGEIHAADEAIVTIGTWTRAHLTPS